MRWSRFLPDSFILALLASVLLASLAPAHGRGTQVFAVLTSLAIALMFFLYGVRLSDGAVREGLLHWRLHLIILLCTFVLYPLLALLLQRLAAPLMPSALWSGVLFLALLPSTVQSSIAFTSIAGGNVPGAVCAATLSNVLGTVLTPLLAALLFRSRGMGMATHEFSQILLQLLLPFILGQLARRWLSGWALRHRGLLAYTDRGSIVLVVYGAFSAAVIGGLWHQLSWWNLLTLLCLEGLLLGAVLAISAYGSRALHFPLADRIAIVLCGSKKSLASGVPMANVLFAGPDLGLTVIPLMLFHQMQLMVASTIAQHYARRAARPDEPALAGAAAQQSSIEM